MTNKSTLQRVERFTQTVNQEILDRAIRHQIYLERYKTGRVNEILRFLDRDVLPDVLDTLESRLRRIKLRGFDIGPAVTQHTKQLASSTGELLRSGMSKSYGTFKKELGNLAVTESEWMGAVLKQTMPVELNLAFPNARLLKSIVTSRPFEGNLLGEWWKGISSNFQVKLQKQLNIGLALGESNAKIVRRIAGDSNLSGLFGDVRRNITSTVRTATHSVASKARMEMLRENDDVIKGYQFVATLDARTTVICMSLDGKVWDKMEDAQVPPLHHQCRSIIIPITKSWKELGAAGYKEFKPGKRVSKEKLAQVRGEVPAVQKYPTWLRRQPKAIQNQALGKTRAKLFREGKVKIDRFINAENKMLTLKQLRVAEGLSLKDIA